MDSATENGGLNVGDMGRGDDEQGLRGSGGGEP